MSEASEILQAIGRLEGKVEQAIAAAHEHRADDTRRFTDVYKRLDEHSEDINKAKGAKGAALWAAGAIAGVVAFAAPYLAKALGLK